MADQYDYGSGDLQRMIYMNQMRGYGGAGVGGSGVGSMYHNALAGVGNDIARAMMYYHAQHQIYNQQMGVANALSRIGVGPQGNLTNAFDQDGNPIKGVNPIIDKNALQQFQTNNHAGQIQATGALQALNRLGVQQMGKAMQAQVRSNATNQAMAQGPVTATDALGRSYIFNPKTGAYQTNTALPRDTSGMTATQQVNMQKSLAAQQQAAQTTAQKTFASTLKSNGLSPNALFDPDKQEQGYYSSGTGFQAVDPEDPNVDTTTMDPVTHVRIGYEAPSGMTKQGKPIGGNDGVVMSLDQLHSLQDSAAQLAGPQATAVLNKLRTLPDDDPQVPQAEQWLSQQIANTGTKEQPVKYSVNTAPPQPPQAAFAQPQVQPNVPMGVPVDINGNPVQLPGGGASVSATTPAAPPQAGGGEDEDE